MWVPSRGWDGLGVGQLATGKEVGKAVDRWVPKHNKLRCPETRKGVRRILMALPGKQGSQGEDCTGGPEPGPFRIEETTTGERKENEVFAGVLFLSI